MTTTTSTSTTADYRISPFIDEVIQDIDTLTKLIGHEYCDLSELMDYHATDTLFLVSMILEQAMTDDGDLEYPVGERFTRDEFRDHCLYVFEVVNEHLLDSDCPLKYGDITELPPSDKQILVAMLFKCRFYDGMVNVEGITDLADQIALIWHAGQY